MSSVNRFPCSAGLRSASWNSCHGISRPVACSKRGVLATAVNQVNHDRSLKCFWTSESATCVTPWSTANSGSRNLVLRPLEECLILQVEQSSVSVVLLAGGVGKRMGAHIPKQYLELCGRPIAAHSFRTFSAMPEVKEIVIVCSPDWRYIFEKELVEMSATKAINLVIKFALPGAERQDSVRNGFQETAEDAAFVAIHDSARPLITVDDFRKCLDDADQNGAAVLGVPVKPTIKQVGADMMVEVTLDRSKLWDVQTPQVIRPTLLIEGFEAVEHENLQVTDDVSMIEAIGKPVKMTEGSYTNIKVTTPDDMSVAERFLSEG